MLCFRWPWDSRRLEAMEGESYDLPGESSQYYIAGDISLLEYSTHIFAHLLYHIYHSIPTDILKNTYPAPGQ